MIGTSNAALMLIESVIAPITNGTTEPPTIIVLMIPEAIGISDGSRSLTAREKMFGNMIELKNPTESRHHIPNCGGKRNPAKTKHMLVAPKIPNDTFAIPLPNIMSRKLIIAIAKKINP